MNLQYVRNDWESAFFGREIYRLNLSEQVTANDELPTNSLVQAKVPTDCVVTLNALQQQGFRVVESEVTFALPLNQAKLAYTTLDALVALKDRHIRPATEQDIAALQAQFGQAFENSRFVEPYFSLAEKVRFYQTWLENAVKGTFDHHCLVEEDRTNGSLHGVISLRRDESCVYVGLLAVAENSRRQGVASRLLEQAQMWAKAAKAERLLISTQLRNRAAINCYQRHGASVWASHYWLYKRSI